MSDKLKVCLVCKKWFNIVDSKYLLRNIIVQFDVSNEIPEANMSRKFLNYSFKTILIDDMHYEFLRCISSVIEYISFENCIVRDIKRQISFSDISFENLKVLKVINCDFWILFANSPNLTELHLSGNSIITDDGLAILQRSMKKLRTLSLYCFVNCDPKTYKRFYPQSSSYEKNPSSYILSLPALKSFISERVNTLKELNLYFNIDSHALEEISNIEKLCLQKISLENSHNCIKGLVTLFKKQQSLRSLNLNGIMGLNRDILKALCKLLPNIEEVYICNGSFTDDSFSYVFRLKKLKKLNIGKNYASELGFCSAIENFEPVHLQYLDVSGITVTNIDLLIHKCKNLVQLNLSHCIVSDELLLFISENLINLQDLSLKKTDITDYGLTGIAKLRPNENEIQEVDQNSHKPLSNLKGLKKLQLSYCEKITDCGITVAIRFQHLEYLDLDGCHIMSYHTVETLLQENPNLRKISRDYLQKVSFILFKLINFFTITRHLT